MYCALVNLSTPRRSFARCETSFHKHVHLQSNDLFADRKVLYSLACRDYEFYGVNI